MATATTAPRRRRSVEGKPRIAVAFTILFFLLLYLPIVVVVLFSVAGYRGWRRERRSGEPELLNR